MKKETKKQKLVDLIKQDPKMIAKNCKHFDKLPLTLEEELINVFSDSRVRKHLKDKGVSEINVGANGFGEVKIEIYLSNDKIGNQKQKSSKKIIHSFLEKLAERIAENK